MSWNPPTGPPNGVPVRPADAKREIEDAVEGARSRDRALRERLVATTAARVRAVDRLALAEDEADEAVALAKRALGRARESAEAGQRADAARWTGAAEVFAMRIRDARREVADLEARLARADEDAAAVETERRENIGRLEAVAAARLPVLSGRKANRTQQGVDETVAALSAPTDDLVAQVTRDVRAAGEDDDEVVTEVTDDELEDEVDYSGTDEILDELRTELGLPTVGPAGDDAAPAPGGGDEDTLEDAPAVPAADAAAPDAAAPAADDAPPMPVARR